MPQENQPFFTLQKTVKQLDKQLKLISAVYKNPYVTELVKSELAVKSKALNASIEKFLAQIVSTGS